MKRTPKAPKTYPPIDEAPPCPPCRFDCAAIWECKDPQVCIHTEPLLSDAVIGWVMVAICLMLGVMAWLAWI